MRLIPLLLIAALAAPLYAGDPADAAERPVDPAAEKWLVGKTRAEVEALLGPPTKVRQRKDGTALRYKFGGPKSVEVPDSTAGRFRGSADPSVPGTELFPTPEVKSLDPNNPSPHRLFDSLGPTRALARGDSLTIRRIDVFLDANNTVVSYSLKPKPKITNAKQTETNKQ